MQVICTTCISISYVGSLLFHTRFSASQRVGCCMQVLAAVPGFNILVWDSRTGEQLCCLGGHECNVHVLEGHPLLPNLMMSASYDGTTRIWDLHSGKELSKCPPPPPPSSPPISQQ